MNAKHLNVFTGCLFIVYLYSKTVSKLGKAILRCCFDYPSIVSNKFPLFS